MSLVPIALPPGVYKNGTEYLAKGRWFASNLVRWIDDHIRPVGGWQRRIVPLTSVNMAAVTQDVGEVIRDIFQWTSVNGGRCVILGSADYVYYFAEDNVVDDITPASGFTPSSGSGSGVGYGVGHYGDLTYGTPRNPSTAPGEGILRWHFDNWGEAALFCASNGSSLFTYTGPAALATIVSNAPTGIVDVVVTKERIVMVIGNASNPRLVQWSARENNTLWTPAEDNEAGGYTIAGDGALLRCVTILDHTLILSESDAHTARYIGPDFVYSFAKVGNSCAPLHPSAVISTDTFVIWPGREHMFMYDGEKVLTIKCDVMGYIKDMINDNGLSKTSAFANDKFDEVWWLYADKDSTEVTRYVIYNYTTQLWYVGEINRTAGGYYAPHDSTIMVDVDGFIYDHELQYLAIEGAYVESGPIELGAGDKNIAVDYIFPDTENGDDLTYTFFGRDMPNNPEVTYGPYPNVSPQAVRAMGRHLRLRVDGAGADWKLGVPRINVVSGKTGFR
jgi:hypothetical protein